MKRLVVMFVLIVLAAAASADMIKVVRVDSDMESTFNCGDRCKFRGDKVPATPLRLRIVRGTISGLAAMASDPRYASTGCIELYSTIVRPRHSRRSGLLDLKFYFNPDWLASNGRNGQFVFVIERDDHPGPEVERMSMLRLPSGRAGAEYFQSGVDVTILAPLNRIAAHATRAKPPARADDGGVMMAMVAKDEPAGGGAPVLQPAPHPTPLANCVDLQYDTQAVRLAAVTPRVRVAVAEGKQRAAGRHSAK